MKKLLLPFLLFTLTLNPDEATPNYIEIAPKQTTTITIKSGRLYELVVIGTKKDSTNRPAAFNFEVQTTQQVITRVDEMLRTAKWDKQFVRFYYLGKQQQAVYKVFKVESGNVIIDFRNPTDAGKLPPQRK